MYYFIMLSMVNSNSTHSITLLRELSLEKWFPKKLVRGPKCSWKIDPGLKIFGPTIGSRFH